MHPICSYLLETESRIFEHSCSLRRRDDCVSVRQDMVVYVVAFATYS